MLFLAVRRSEEIRNDCFFGRITMQEKEETAEKLSLLLLEEKQLAEQSA